MYTIQKKLGDQWFNTGHELNSRERAIQAYKVIVHTFPTFEWRLALVTFTEVDPYHHMPEEPPGKVRPHTRKPHSSYR